MSVIINGIFQSGKNLTSVRNWKTMGDIWSMHKFNYYYFEIRVLDLSKAHNNIVI